MTAASAPIDARDAVLCSWVFDHTAGAPAPFGFTLVREWRDDAAGYLAVLLRTRRTDGGEELRLVNRGTRWETSSPGAMLRAFGADMGANLAILFGDADAPIITAALRAAEEAAALAGAAVEFRVLGQSLGGGLAQLQAVALHLRAPALGGRFATFASSDVARVVRRRLGADVASLPLDLGDNWVSPRDGLTGPRAVFGTALLGRTHVVDDMRGPFVVAWPGLEFHRANAWVNHCAGRRVDESPLAHPASAAEWRTLRAKGCAVPEGWPRDS